MKRKSVRKYFETFGAPIRGAVILQSLFRLVAPVLPIALVAMVIGSAWHSDHSATSYGMHFAAMAGLVAASDGARELREQRVKLGTQMLAITAKAKAENRGLTVDERESWDKMNADIENFDESIKRIEATDKLNASFAETKVPKLDNINVEPSAETVKKNNTAHDKAFGSFMRKGISALSPEDQEIMNGNFVDADGRKIKAAQTVTTTGGGYLIPAGFSGQLEEALKFFGGMLQAAETVTTDTGNPLPWPTTDDRSNVGELLAINTAAAAQDFTFGQITLGAYKYSSKIVLVPIELLQDSYFDLNTFLARKLGERLGRILNTHFTTGTGTAQPNGIVTAAASGKVGLTGQTLTVIYNDLVDLYHSIDIAHRNSPGCKWMLADSSVKVIKKLVDTAGRPLWQPYGASSIGAAYQDTILDKTYIVNNDVATMAANAKSILFGDLSKYKIRKVMGFTLLRLVERYAEFGQVGFLAFMRADGNLIDAGSNPVKYYANSAT